MIRWRNHASLKPRPFPHQRLASNACIVDRSSEWLSIFLRKFAMSKINRKPTADRLGLNLDDVEQLIAGRATGNVCTRLGLYLADVEDFIRVGSVSANLANRLVLSPLAAAEELSKALTREGRIGLLI